MYARTYNEAKNYLTSQYENCYICEQSSECPCGESIALIAEDEDGNELEEVIICDACWQGHSWEQVDSPSTMSDEDLADAIEDAYSVYDVEVVQRWKMSDESDLILVKLTMEDCEEREAYIIHYSNDNSLFLTFDEVNGFPITPAKWEMVGYEGKVALNEENMPYIEEQPVATRLSIAKSIRKARIAQGLTIRALASKCGLDKTPIVRLESGRHNFTIDTLAKVCAALGISVTIG